MTKIKRLCFGAHLFLNTVSKLENLIRSDRNGDWKLYLQSVKDLVSIFSAFYSENYLRKRSLYLEDMHMQPEISPSTHNALIEGRFAIKRTNGSFKAVMLTWH